MNFSALAGCTLKARFGILRALQHERSINGSFTYNALVNGAYAQIIESQLPVDAKILFNMNGHKITFSYNGFAESVQAVAVLDEPVIVKVILVNEEVIEETLDIKYPSVKTSLQGCMAYSSIGGKPQIKKSLVLAVNTQDYSVNHITINADPVIQESLQMKMDFINDLSAPIQKVEGKECATCPYSPICKNDALPVVSCSTCAFFKIGEQTCSLGNHQGIRCQQHLYNPNLLVNHSHKRVDVQNLFVEYEGFVNSNNPVAGKEVLTSDAMLASHRFDNDRILDKNLNDFVKNFGAKIL